MRSCKLCWDFQHYHKQYHCAIEFILNGAKIEMSQLIKGMPVQHWVCIVTHCGAIKKNENKTIKKEL